MSSEWTRRAVLALASFLVALLLAESGFRVYHAWVKRRSPYVGDSELSFLHARYLRQGEPADALSTGADAERERDTERLIVLGDSVTDGYGVERSERYQERLATMLGEAGDRHEIVTLAVPQYSTRQEVTLLSRIGVGIKPDRVILAYVLNDPIEDGSINRFFRRDRAASLLLHWIHERLGRSALDGERVEGCEFFDYYSRAHCIRDTWRTVQDAFGELEALSRKHEFGTLVVIFPLLDGAPGSSFADYPWAFVHEQVSREARSHGFAVLDLLPTFARHSPAELKITPADLLHPNALGHRLAAEAIFAEISSRSGG